MTWAEAFFYSVVAVCVAAYVWNLTERLLDIYSPPYTRKRVGNLEIERLRSVKSGGELFTDSLLPASWRKRMSSSRKV